MRAAVLLLSLMLAACTADVRVPPVAAGVDITHDPTQGVVVTYTLGAGVDGVRFDDAAGDVRQNSWTVLTPGYRLVNEQEGQVLRRVDGVSAAGAARIRIDTTPLDDPRRYQPLVQFSDGSVAVYTGYLEGVTIGGRRSAQLTLAGEPATYVHLGDIPELADGVLRYRLDPALPEWVRFTIQHRLPQFIDFYAGQFGMDAPALVPVMVSFRGEGVARHLGGAVVGGLLQVELRGSAWHEDDPWAAERLERFLAHEAAHLWNAGRVTFRPGTPAWLVEGGADALAERALLALGRVDAARYAAMQAYAHDTCMEDAEANAYACGNARAAETEARAGVDLFTLWGKVMERAAAADGHYDEAAFEAVVIECAAAAAASNRTGVLCP